MTSSEQFSARLRAVWRVVIVFGVLFPALAVTVRLESVVNSTTARMGYRPLLLGWSFPLAVLIATTISVRWVNGASWDYVWLGRQSLRFRPIVLGLVVGAVAIGLPSLLLMVTGELRAVSSTPGSWWTAAGLTFANLLPAAAGEELMVRGYLFAVMRETIGWRWALIVTSIVFGLLHLDNPGVDAESILLVVLAGFFLGSLLLATQSLYATIAAHFAWNWVMAAGLHTPVSGIPIIAPDYRVVDAGPDWLTGGTWGPEGGLAAALSMFIVVVYIYARHLRRMER